MDNKKSRIQILFYDEYQTIRATDIEVQRFRSICKPHLFKYIELTSQMRCKGGNGYYEYIRDILEKSDFDIHQYKRVSGYELKVFDNVSELFNIINDKNKRNSLCRVVTGPGWSMEDTIIIDGKEYRWARDKFDNINNVIFSIHKIQGFDLNYAGVIFGKEVFYNEKEMCVAINKKELRDNFTKCNG